MKKKPRSHEPALPIPLNRQQLKAAFSRFVADHKRLVEKTVAKNPKTAFVLHHISPTDAFLYDLGIDASLGEGAETLAGTRRLFILVANCCTWILNQEYSDRDLLRQMREGFWLTPTGWIHHKLHSLLERWEKVLMAHHKTAFELANEHLASLTDEADDQGA